MPDCCEANNVANLERRTLWTLVIINATMFGIEAIAGWWGEHEGDAQTLCGFAHTARLSV